MSMLLDRHTRDSFALEPGGWLSVRRAMPELHALAGEELLARTQAELPRHLRYARAAGGVVLMAEDGLGEVENAMACARDRLIAWLSESPDSPGAIPEQQAIETALADLATTTAAMDWSQRDGRLVISAGALSPVELKVRGVPGGLRIEGHLTFWDGAGEPVRAAIGEFLVRAQAALRFARAELDSSSVRISSHADVTSESGDLSLAMAGVAAGCHRLIRQVAALTLPELAEQYLELVAGETSEAGGSW